MLFNRLHGLANDLCGCWLLMCLLMLLTIWNICSLVPSAHIKYEIRIMHIWTLHITIYNIHNIYIYGPSALKPIRLSLQNHYYYLKRFTLFFSFFGFNILSRIQSFAFWFFTSIVVASTINHHLMCFNI